MWLNSGFILECVCVCGVGGLQVSQVQHMFNLFVFISFVVFFEANWKTFVRFLPKRVFNEFSKQKNMGS